MIQVWKCHSTLTQCNVSILTPPPLSALWMWVFLWIGNALVLALPRNDRY